MATSYKTPGVYVEEIPKLPPSVAQVETALPAFIGYTEIAEELSPDDLINKPRRIGSLVEYEYYYGNGPSLNVDVVNIDDSNKFVSANVASKYYMYDALRLFFANGGGDCFIVAIGKYGTDPAASQFNSGIDLLLKEDDPTMILFPDAAALSVSDLASVQNYALAHCANEDENRKDRVAIMDLRYDDRLGTNFRSNIGINFLSYGMAYTPWLNINLPKNVAYADIKDKIKRNGAQVTLSGLTSDAGIQAQITQLGNAYTDQGIITNATALLSSPSTSLNDKYQSLIADFNNAQSVVKFRNVVTFLVSIFKKIDDYLDNTVSDYLTNTEIQNAVSGSIATFKTIFTAVIGIDKEAADKLSGDGYTVCIKQADITNAIWGSTLVSGATESTYMTNTDPLVNCQLALAKLQVQFDLLNRAYISIIVDGASETIATQEDSLLIAMPVYKDIVNGVSTSTSVIPPSGAVAGIYAMVDRTRGVWKAPANVSLANVISPTETYTKSELDNLNIDTNAGKSINAIRTFFGKGTLVYGARTLAGNDNEWRYIPVRRLFIMVEKSVKRATEQFVFEPNDANTWVKVQAMIENFLFLIWRQGALQGAKPEQAYYVAVGLGKTMNPIDILEGRMIIEIGMAAVRPAEFIILRFSHKMAES